MSTFVLAALKGQQLLKQWVIEAAGSPETLAIQYWPQAKAMGASRLCAASSGNAWFACYDGKGLTPQKLSLPVPVPTPPAPKCPPGQVFNAQGKCVPIGQSQPEPGLCPTGAQIKAFAASKSLTWFVTSIPPTAPPTAAAWAVYARVYSNSNRSFYGWNASTHSWVKDVALTNELLAVCSAKKLTASGPSTAKCQPGYHYDAHAGRCIPNFSLLAGVKTKQFVGEVKWLGENVGVGAIFVHRFLLVAYKGKSILKQWGQDVTQTYMNPLSPISDPPTGHMETGLAQSKDMVVAHWAEAKAMGADRLCAARVFDDNSYNPFVCYNGKTFWQMAPELVSTSNKPTITCPSGQGAVQHSDGSWGCKPITCPPGTKLVNGLCVSDTGWCPPGQHYSAPLKKCIPIKQKPYSGPVPTCPPGMSFSTKTLRCEAPAYRGGMTQGAEVSNEYSLLRKRREIESPASQFVGEVKWLSGPPTVSCGPGKYVCQHPDGSYGCRKWPSDNLDMGLVPGMPCRDQCPTGQHWSAPLEKCVPSKGFHPASPTAPWAKRPVSPPYRGGQTQGVHPFAGLGEPPSNVLTFKAILLAWSKSPEAQTMVPKLPFDNYGDPSLDDPNTWKCSRDGRILTAFSVWWNNAKKTPTLTVGVIPTTGLCAGIQTTELDQPHMDALQAWSSGSWPNKCPVGTKLVNGLCVPDPNWSPALVVCPPGQFLNPATGKCEPLPSIPVTKVETPQAPSIPQQNAPQAQPQTQPPGGQPTAPAAPTVPAKKSSSTGLLVLGAIGVAVVGAVAVMARKRTEEMLALNPRRMPKGYAAWISKVAELMNASRPHPVEYENVNVDFWRQLYSAGYTPKEAVDALNDW